VFEISETLAIKAVVERVFPGGNHGPFAVASSSAISGSVTFSLEPTVWQEEKWPEEGAVVYLTKLIKKRAGWRSKKGRHWLLSDEQTAEKEKIMKKLKVFISGLKEKFFPTEEDSIWEKWVDYADRDEKSLIELLSSDARDNFKKRALFILLVPSNDFNPLYWKKNVGQFYYRDEFLKKLNDNQLDYVADLIYEFCLALRSSEPKNVAEGGEGFVMFMSVPDKLVKPLDYYNRCILSLLPSLPEEKAKKLFSLFSFIDLVAYFGLDDASGYNPFRDLLYSDISEELKKVADDKMRQIILSELAGKTKPRKDWEGALHQYADIVQSMSHSKPSYSLDLYASQIQFIMDNRKGRSDLISNYLVINLFNIFVDEKFAKLRRTIARYSLLENNEAFSRFSIYGKETQQAVDYILKEFGDDHELVAKVKKLQEERDKRQAEQKAHQTKEKLTEEEILSQMS